MGGTQFISESQIVSENGLLNWPCLRNRDETKANQSDCVSQYTRTHIYIFANRHGIYMYKLQSAN
jgi:hypothetical protein